MQDIATEQTLPKAPPRRRGARAVFLAVILAFVAGVALTAWLTSQGKLDFAMRYFSGRESAPARIAATPPAREPQAAGGLAAAAPLPPALGTVEARLALLEERMSRIDDEAEAATGHAARAEALLIAFATRRLVEKGDELGALRDQLRLRFGDAQPNAVDTVVAFAEDPVTRDQLLGRLETLAARLGSAPSESSLWSRVSDEFSSLFVVRRDAVRANAPEDRLARARLLLTTGKVDEAIDMVRHMPGALAADDWIEDARRYGEAQRALDLIETSALLQPQLPIAPMPSPEPAPAPTPE